MGLDWNRILCLVVFVPLFGLALCTGEARIILGSLLVLAWPFVFIWFGDELGSTLGLSFGTVNRVSEGTLVKIGGWIILGIYLAGITGAFG